MAKLSLTRQIQLLPRISAAFYVVLAGLAVWLMNDTSYPLRIGYQAKDVLASQSGSVLAPASRLVADLPMRLALAVVLLFAAGFAVSMFTIYQRDYERGLRNRVLPIRWVGMAITAGLMLEILAILSGYSDLFVLKLIVGLMVVTALLGWLAEKQNQTAKSPVWSAFGLSVFSGALAWLPIAGVAIGTPVFGLERSPWYVYALYGVTLVGFLAIGLNQWLQHRRHNQWQNYRFVERNYLLLGLLTKVSFAAILIIGLLK